MRFSSSLKENILFRRLYAKGRSAAGSYLVLYCRKNGTGQNRVGYTVSKKLAGPWSATGFAAASGRSTGPMRRNSCRAATSS